MDVISKDAGRELTLTLRGELDHHGAKDVMQRMELALDAALPIKLTLDFSGVSFMDSSGIAVVMRAQKRMRALGGGAVLREDNRLLLRCSGTVFWLDRPLPDIMSTDFRTGRPLLAAGREALERLAAERRALYAACAHHRIAEPLLEQAISQIEEIWKGARP